MIAFQVKDMTCGHSVSTITKAVKTIDEGASIEVNLAAHSFTIEPVVADEEALKRAIESAGYAPVLLARIADPAAAPGDPGDPGLADRAVPGREHAQLHAGESAGAGAERAGDRAAGAGGERVQGGVALSGEVAGDDPGRRQIEVARKLRYGGGRCSRL